MQEQISTKMSLSKTRKRSVIEHPTSLQFDKFMPCICRQMSESIKVIVEKLIKEDYPSSRRGKSTIAPLSAIKIIKDDAISTKSLGSGDVHIKSYYNHRNQLIEIAITACPVGILRKVIQAINFCLPSHKFLKKFVIKGKWLSQTVLNEIGNFLPHSNITDVCLDDTYLPQGDYHVLFKRVNKLQNISLCRCKINDEVCKTIADNLNFKTPASKTLVTLDLSSNLITNSGASYLGLMLRTNRTLLYLNLSDNIIKDMGASNILQSLMSFSLTDDEKCELKKRRLKYAVAKLEQYKKCEQELRDRMKSEENIENVRSKLNIKPFSIHNNRVRGSVFNEKTLKEPSEEITENQFGKFRDIFDKDNVTYVNERLHCVGNLTLCYLNLAYNDIEYCTLKKLCEVLKYQSSINMSDCKGLMKVVIDGNNLPVHDELLETIQTYLQNSIKKALPLRKLSGHLSNSGKKGTKKRL